MTRINVGVRAYELTNKHLLAEHREIKRIPNCIKKGRYNLKNIPVNFKLGENHVRFFYNKLEYLHIRYLELYEECVKRGFNITDFSESFNDLPKELYNNYIEKKVDREIILERIKERLKK